ncbi:general odorant-binding protein lush isoform X2 [Anopheles gambiae]|uniref:general odorant-binding protein lush isoform X2 n=1 Tax=Anopheles gambiae TaxID=7165 RepID=UPI002AC89DEC|nr:general odorant-binding protein lush isoform X2 [Anopheles gambiae]
MSVSVLVSSLVVLFCVQCLIEHIDGAMTMKQLTNSMDMMRQACAPKFKVEEAELHGLRKSIFPANPDKELKCYAMCIAQMAGTVSMLANISSNSNNMVWFPFFRQMTKKGEISFSKTMAQIEAMLPPEMKTMAKEALTHCKDTQTSYKDPCDKAYFSAKCAADFTPDTFMFP